MTFPRATHRNHAILFLLAALFATILNHLVALPAHGQTKPRPALPDISTLTYIDQADYQAHFESQSLQPLIVAGETYTVSVTITNTRYEPYGATAAGSTPTIGFTGHVNDPDTGLIYMQQRNYDPYAGRFLGTDPVLTRKVVFSQTQKYQSKHISLIDQCLVSNGDRAFVGTPANGALIQSISAIFTN